MECGESFIHTFILIPAPLSIRKFVFFNLGQREQMELADEIVSECEMMRENNSNCSGIVSSASASAFVSAPLS